MIGRQRCGALIIGAIGIGLAAAAACYLACRHRTVSETVLVAEILETYQRQRPANDLKITNPYNGTLFPPEIAPPTFQPIPEVFRPVAKSTPLTVTLPGCALQKWCAAV